MRDNGVQSPSRGESVSCVKDTYSYCDSDDNTVIRFKKGDSKPPVRR